MRFALRNQSKIEKALGGDTLEVLLEALRQAFESFNDFEIEARIDKETTPYPTLTVDCSSYPYNTAVFYVVGRQYDVLKLAFNKIGK
jgi:hypothetical protein